jgi:hypothetical protein
MLHMTKKKTALTRKEVEAFLQELFCRATKNVRPMIEGEDSQAFSFEWGETDYVMRINKTIAGFQKDAYAYHHFRSASIPIPKVFHLGHIDEQHAFIICKSAIIQNLSSRTHKEAEEKSFPCLPLVISLSTCYTVSDDSVAQWIECAPPKCKVAGSTPATVTTTRNLWPNLLSYLDYFLSFPIKVSSCFIFRLNTRSGIVI